MIIGRSSGLWKTGTPLSLTFVREGQFVADGNGLMGTQVPKPSRGTVAFRNDVAEAVNGTRKRIGV